MIKKIGSAVMGLMLSASVYAKADAVSPYSPAFYLSPYQVQWDSSFTRTQTNYTISSRFLNNSANSISYGASQALSIGLPYQFSLGITELYIKPVVTNPANPNAATQGFKNPVLTGGRVWILNDANLIKGLVSVQPNMNVVAGASTYNFGITGVHTTPNRWVGSLSINMTTNDVGSGGIATISAGLSKAFSGYLVNASLGSSRFSSTLLQSGYINPSYGYAGTIEVSREVLQNAWLGASYSLGSVNSTYMQNFMSLTFNNRTQYNAAGISLRVLF